MTHNPYDGPAGPQGPQYGPGSPNPNSPSVQSLLAKVFTGSPDLPNPVRQLQLAAIASAVGYLITQIISLVVSSVVLSGYASGLGIEGMAGAGTAFGIVLLIFALGLYALVIIPLLGRKNWGRILGIVFAFLGGISSLFNILSVGTTFALSGGLGAITLIQGIVILGTAVWFLVFAFRADVAAWYTPHSSVGYQQGWSAGGQAGHYNPGNQPPGPGQYPPGAGNQGPTYPGPQGDQYPPQGPPSSPSN
ncbi:MAG TPA: hypothetical protein H9884_05805 [Candidatus Yaniella excrementigallinarum]|nr:hypothetical protein [Candidatus Yaniella excrementigallinarum]